jgi:multidrug efflux pump subunit AcrB
MFRLEGLTLKSDYQVRVGAVRQSTDDSGASVTLSGPFSPGTPFTTLAAAKVSSEQGQPQSPSTAVKQSSAAGSRRLSEQQLSVLYLLAFAVIAVAMAFFANWFIN